MSGGKRKAQSTSKPTRGSRPASAGAPDWSQTTKTRSAPTAPAKKAPAKKAPAKKAPAKKAPVTKSTKSKRRGPLGIIGAPWKTLTWKQRGFRVVKWFSFVGVAVVMALIAGFVVVYNTIDLPDPNAAFEVETTNIVFDDGSQLGSFNAGQNRQSIHYSEMPDDIKNAVVAAENRSFWTDSGIDLRGIVRAAWSNASGGATQGASTITQQYIKILYLTSERSVQRKLKEAVLALKIQRQLSKEEILEGYLNTIYFGRGAYGIQAAARTFFNVDAAELNLRQAAVLASVINNPTRFDPANGKSNRAALRGRYEYVLGGMLDTSTITERQHDQAVKALPAFPEQAPVSAYGGQKGHMLKLVRDELLRLGFSETEIDGGGLTVTTTFNKEAMTAAEQGVLEARPADKSDKELHAAVAMVEPGTGALKGFYGGQDYLQSQINWAAAGGPVGSTMKAVTVAAALDQGFSLEDTFFGNTPYTFPDGLTIANSGQSAGDPYGHSYGSAVDLTKATASSINTAFVDISQKMDDGPKSIYTMAEKMGIPPQDADPDYPGIPSTSRDFYPEDTLITLGKARVSAINMANAYATIANGGARADVHVISEVKDFNGDVKYTYRANTTRAFSKEVAADTTYALEQVVDYGTGTVVQAVDRPAAGKTGTATDDDDHTSATWFVGYTPQLATAVMYVRGDGDDPLDGYLDSAFGSGAPAETWVSVMTRALQGEPIEDFPVPAFVDGDAPGETFSPPPT
ncbi:MAG: transglycosylase domain-containing protein, partial [Nocardioides sp.]